MIPIRLGPKKSPTTIRQVLGVGAAECLKQLTSSDWYFF